MTPVLLLHGTWGRADNGWWRPGSEFWRAAESCGVTFADPDDPFEWSGRLDGVVGQHSEWWLWGKALRREGKRWPALTVIAHSHGGQVAIYAASFGLPIETLVTAGTPVRQDMLPIMHAARPQIKRWVHLFAEHDPVQLAGEVGDGAFAPKREMDLADFNFHIPGSDHDALHDPTVWTDNYWWQYVT